MNRKDGIVRDPDRPGFWKIETSVKMSDGKWHHLKALGYQRRSLAVEDKPRQLSMLRDRMGFAPVKGSMSELCESYIAHMKNRLKPTTFHDMERDVRARIEKPFQGKSVREVFSGDSLERWRQRFLAETADLTQKRVNWIMSHMENISRYAFLIGSAGEPGLRLGLSASERVKGRIHHKTSYSVWTYDQFLKFISTFSDDDRYAVLFQWLFFSGCRIGEALAIQWSDVDLKGKCVSITKNSSPGVGTGKTEVFTTKTSAGVRDIFLSDGMASRLSKLKAAYESADGDFVFFDKSPIGRMTVRRVLDAHTDAAGLPRIKIHEIRHTTNTWLLSKTRTTDELKAITERLGRSSLKVTMDVYFHSKDKTRRDLADEIGIGETSHKEKGK